MSDRIQEAANLIAQHFMRERSKTVRDRIVNSRECQCGHSLPWQLWDAPLRVHHMQVLIDAGLLATEVEWGAEGEKPEPWAAALDERTRDEAARYVERFGGHVVRRGVTAWREPTP